MHKWGSNNVVQFINGASILLTFFVFRLLWGPYLTWSFIQDTAGAELLKDYAYASHVPYACTAIVLCISLSLLNVYW